MIKENVDDLAIFGGAPAFAELRHVGQPNIGNRRRFIERVNEILDNKWLTNSGPFVQALERRIEEMIGVRNCIATCNGTVALELAIRALHLQGEVIIPSFTFVATAHALQWQEITPVFCDIDEKNYTIDPIKIESLLTPRTSGIIGVHLWGRPCDVISLTEIARRHGLKLLFDAAHAYGCSLGGRMVGSFGDAEVFSFHATKFVNAFEGGAVVTNDDKLAAKIRLMKNFGFAGLDDVVYVGTNGKMSEVSAAMGLTSLESMPEFVEVNHAHYKRYKARLQNIPGVRLLPFDEREKFNYQYITIEVDSAVTQITRDSLLRILQKENVLARRYFYPGCHNMEPYRSYYPHAKLLLPVTERINGQIMLLPTGTAVSETDCDQICDLIKLVATNGRELKERLSASASCKKRAARVL